MASYFQFDNDDHLALLSKDLRTSSDLEAAAARAERDVIQFYTRYVTQGDVYALSPMSDPLLEVPAAATALGNGFFVFLRGYRVDASATDVDPRLKLALRDTIIDVVRWRLLQGKTNPMFRSSDKQLYQEGATTKRFPPHWNRGLDLFDTRPPVLRI